MLREDAKFTNFLGGHFISGEGTGGQNVLLVEVGGQLRKKFTFERGMVFLGSGLTIVATPLD